MMLAASGDANANGRVLRRARGSDEDPDDGVLSSDHHIQQDGNILIDMVNDEAGDDAVRKKKTFASKASASLAKAIVGSKGKTPSKVLFLDGVRGLAAILVVLQHCGYVSGGGIEIGQCGVDLFFVLSAFLLTWLLYKKSEQLLAQHASYRRWFVMLLDYFVKRFLRVYPLFVVVAIIVWALPNEKKQQYFYVRDPEHYDLYKVLTFEFKSRYHVFWTLPLEIGYYFLIPVVVLMAIGLRRAWWVPLFSLYYWICHSGWTQLREDHQPLQPHLPTFICGSLAAIVAHKIDVAIKEHRQLAATTSRWRHAVLIFAVRVVECVAFALLLSELFHGLFYDWVPSLPRPSAKRPHFISFYATVLIVIELLAPSWVATVFEWNLFRYWGKVSFSVYLLHSFVIYAHWVRDQPKYYNKLFAQFSLVLLLGTVSYHLIEYPSQLLSARISRFLSDRGGLVQPINQYMPVAVTIQKVKVDDDDDVLENGRGGNEDDDGEIRALHKK